MLKSILYLLFGILLTLSSGCENKEEQKLKEKQKQTKSRFQSIGDCLKQKKSEAGISEDSKPPFEMLQQCISLTKQ